ncbi:MAG: hypothetical protein MJE68_02510 [Proteobacteria bacterium]|nr:hypothetical protein [Pseudomonadota bacterium]
MDYELDPTVLTFPNGSVQGDRQCVTVSINDDVAVENNEYFYMNLTSSDELVEVSNICQRAIITIIDTDGKIIIIIIIIR